MGCCYNLSSDETSNDRKELYGFPMSDAVGNLGLQLDRSARDLACQVRSRYTPSAAFDNHAVHNVLT